MNLSKQKLGELIQLIALFAAMMSIWGWFCWLLTLTSDMTLDRWRADKILLPFYEIGEQVKYAPDEVEQLKRHRRVAVHGFPTEEKLTA